MPQFIMIGFHQLSNDDPVLTHSPLLRAALLTLQYVQDYGPIGLTKTGAFKRIFIHWAAEHFDWPGFSRNEFFEVNTVFNEYDFPLLKLLHFTLLQMKLARHFKGEFQVTKRGARLLKSPASLFIEIIPFFLFEIDHVAYSRFRNGPVGSWNVWLNMLNVEVEDGANTHQLYGVFYGLVQDNSSGLRNLNAFHHCVLEPLYWSGLLFEIELGLQTLSEIQYFKTPLWRATLELDTNDILDPVQWH
jgi:hypothetical protein